MTNPRSTASNAGQLIYPIMLFTGWKGGQMVYLHHVGVSDEHDEVPPYREPRRTT
jgi:hypothetical protein